MIFSGWTAVLAAILAMSALAMLWWRRRVEPAAGPQATGGEDNDRAARREPVGLPSTGNGTTRALPWWDVMPPWRTCSRQPAVLGVARRPPRNCSIGPSPKVTGARSRPGAHRAVPDRSVLVHTGDVCRRRHGPTGAAHRRDRGTVVTFGIRPGSLRSRRRARRDIATCSNSADDSAVAAAAAPHRHARCWSRRPGGRVAGCRCAGRAAATAHRGGSGGIRVAGAALDPPDRVPVLPGFTRTVGSVEWGLVSAFDFDTALRPRLTRVAAARLADRHGVDLSSQPAEAAGLLGAEAWALLDPARPPLGDRSVPGPDRAAVARVLDAIERV